MKRFIEYDSLNPNSHELRYYIEGIIDARNEIFEKTGEYIELDVLKLAGQMRDTICNREYKELKQMLKKWDDEWYEITGQRTGYLLNEDKDLQNKDMEVSQ